MNEQNNIPAKYEKAGLRKQYISLRTALSEKWRHEQDMMICRSIADTEAFRNADALLLYCPFGEETDVMPLAEIAWSRSLRVAFPRCDKASHTMKFYDVGSRDELVSGAFGILEPQAGQAEPCGEKTVCVVPGLVFDRYGYRVGYGGGYYDRFLENYTGTTIAPVREGFLFEKALPHESFDKHCDYIATQKNVYGAESE